MYEENFMKIIAVISAAFILVFGFQTAGCKTGEQSKIVDPVVVQDSVPVVPGWTLVWNDEFSGTAVDLKKWGYEVNGNGGGNNELQYYTSRPENSFIDSGKLVIQANKETYSGKSYTSARMRTLFKGDWLYGRFDIRAKLPYGQGIWPAIWMLPSDWEYGGWPTSGEIDIMELLGHETSKVYGTIHYGSDVQHHLQKGGSYSLSQGTFAGSYHTFSVVWDSTSFTWYVEGIQYYMTYMMSPFDRRFHMLLNVAVGGNWPGSPDAFTTFPQRMYVDYVRVYKKAN
jgi:beta-glucanase (GH16 family)